jgi:hypothetical protein
VKERREADLGCWHLAKYVSPIVDRFKRSFEERSTKLLSYKAVSPIKLKMASFPTIEILYVIGFYSVFRLDSSTAQLLDGFVANH